MQTSIVPKLFLTVWERLWQPGFGMPRGVGGRRGDSAQPDTPGCGGAKIWLEKTQIHGKSIWIYKPQYLWHQPRNQPVPVWGWLIQLLQAASGPWTCSSSPRRVQEVRDGLVRALGRGIASAPSQQPQKVTNNGPWDLREPRGG